MRTYENGASCTQLLSSFRLPGGSATGGGGVGGFIVNSSIYEMALLVSAPHVPLPQREEERRRARNFH